MYIEREREMVRAQKMSSPFAFAYYVVSSSPFSSLFSSSFLQRISKLFFVSNSRHHSGHARSRRVASPERRLSDFPTKKKTQKRHHS